MNKYIKATPS